MDDFLEGARAILAERYETRLHHARNQSRHQACDRHHALQTVGFQGLHFARLHFAVTEELRRRRLRHGPDARERDNAAILCADENRRFSAEAEVGILDNAGREHTGHASIHGVPAEIEKPHSSVRRGVRAGGHGALHSAGRESHRPLKRPASGLRLHRHPTEQKHT